MKFEYTKRDENWAKPISPVSEAQIHRVLRNKPTVCILCDKDANFLQVGRSGFCCCLEWHNTIVQRHFRAFQQPPVVPWPGTTRIFLLDGELALKQEEYFSPQQAQEALLTFLRHEPFPAYVQWRDITAELRAKGCTFFPTHENHIDR